MYLSLYEIKIKNQKRLIIILRKCNFGIALINQDKLNKNKNEFFFFQYHFIYNAYI